MSKDEKARLVEPHELPEDLSTVFAVDGLRGCPEDRWDGPYKFRCSLGVSSCAIHGKFRVYIGSFPHNED